jgi:hypothetical protein
MKKTRKSVLERNRPVVAKGKSKKSKHFVLPKAGASKSLLRKVGATYILGDHRK